MTKMYEIKENFWKMLNWKMLGKCCKFQKTFSNGNIEHETEKAMLVTLYFSDRYGYSKGSSEVWIPKSCLE